MTVIENKVLVAKPVETIYSLISNLNNHQQLMPDNIHNWTSTGDEARFTIQNMAKLALKVSNRIENKSIEIIPSEKAPFDLSLKWTLNIIDKQKTEVYYSISADLNMMMKMLVVPQLQKLVDFELDKLKELI